MQDLESHTSQNHFPGRVHAGNYFYGHILDGMEALAGLGLD